MFYTYIYIYHIVYKYIHRKPYSYNLADCSDKPRLTTPWPHWKCSAAEERSSRNRVQVEPPEEFRKESCGGGQK